MRVRLAAFLIWFLITFWSFALSTNEAKRQCVSSVAAALLTGSAVLNLPSMTIITGDRIHTTQAQRDAAYLHLIDIVINGDRYQPATTCF